MARKKKDIIKVNPLDIVPEHLQPDKTSGMEDLSQYITPPRIKIVQKQADEAILVRFGAGDVIIVPTFDLVCEMERDTKGNATGDSNGFDFVPLFFYAEWCCWNPIALKGKAPVIRERSLDPTSSLAVKAKNPRLRTEPHPDDPSLQIRYIEHLNFVIALPGITEHPLLTFSRGSHGKGRQMCGLLRQRNAPLYGCRLHAHQVKIENDMGAWWALEVINPPGETTPWVDDKKVYAEFKALHERYREAHKNAKLVSEYDEPDVTVVEGDTEY